MQLRSKNEEENKTPFARAAKTNSNARESETKVAVTINGSTASSNRVYLMANFLKKKIG